MNRIFYVIGVVVVAVRHAVLHFEVRRGELDRGQGARS
jgi:hypothetical protein